MKRLFLMYAVTLAALFLMFLVFFGIRAAEARDDRDPGGNDGVHIVPLRDSGKIPEGHELRHGQFARGTKFYEEPKGWRNGDPCWKYTETDDRRVWEFSCD